MKISVEVIKQRKRKQISYGAGENNEILPYVSAHSNFAAYVPILLILLYFLEQSPAVPRALVVILGSCIFLGRLLHYLGVAREKTNFKLRVVGMQLTLWPLVIMSSSLIILFFKQFFL